MDDTIELKGNISLAGFKDLEPAKMIVVKKITGNYVKKMQEKFKFEKLHLHLKSVHESKFEIQAKAIINNETYNSEIVDFNLYFALDKALAKIIEGVN
jgi:ribosome-associated translation inhibitor RaiA